LGMWGIVLWQEGLLSKAYARCVLLLPAVLLAASMYLLSQPNTTMHELLPTLCHACAALIGSTSLQARGIHELLGRSEGLLDTYVQGFGFEREWHWLSFQESMLIVISWISTVLGKLLLATDPICCARSVEEVGFTWVSLDVICAALAASYTMVLILCQLHVSGAMELAVEKFYLRWVIDQGLARNKSAWNLLQAVLRRTASVVDGCFCSLLAAFLGLFVLNGVQVLLQRGAQAQPWHLGSRCSCWWCMWMLPPWILLLYELYRAASVTEQCALVPSMVNSWTQTASSDDQANRQIHYAVQHIIHSAAGFYIKGVRITSYMTIKVTYLLCVCVCTSLSKLLLDN